MGLEDHDGDMDTDKIVTVGPDGHVRSVEKATFTTGLVDRALEVDPTDGLIDVKTDDSSITVNAANELTVATGGITNVHIEEGAVDSRTILDGSIQNVDLSDNSVDSRTIVNGSILEEGHNGG